MSGPIGKHRGFRESQVHTPVRWESANSTEFGAIVVAVDGSDDLKFSYQRDTQIVRLWDEDAATWITINLDQANPAAASQAEAEAGTEAALRSFSPLRIAQAIAALETGGALHASSHENGGADEIDVTGLSGLLADPQTPLMTSAVQLVENAPILFDAAGSADGKYSGLCIAGTAGATLAFGDLCYLAVADSRWELTDADAAATAGGVMLGMCVLAAAADGDPTRMLLIGTIRADAAFPTLTIGAPAYVSTTAGDIQVAQPSGTDDVIRVVGHALTADELFFRPSQDYMTAE